MLRRICSTDRPPASAPSMAPSSRVITWFISAVMSISYRTG